ncbi:MAG: helix-turn-helix domain-containing protein [Acidimicrobiales bacterium]
MAPTRQQAPVNSKVAVPTSQQVGARSSERGTGGGLLDYEAAARYLGTTPRRVRKLWQSRRLAAVKVGRCVRFLVADVDAFIAANRVPPTDRPARLR